MRTRKKVESPYPNFGIIIFELRKHKAICVTGEIQFQGSFADAYLLGYLFLEDVRKRKVVFLLGGNTYDLGDGSSLWLAPSQGYITFAI